MKFNLSVSIYLVLLTLSNMACSSSTSAELQSGGAAPLSIEALLSGSAEGAIALFGKPSETQNSSMIYASPAKLKALDADRMVLTFQQYGSEKQGRLWLSMTADHGWKTVMKELGYDVAAFTASDPVKQNMSSKGFTSYHQISLKREGKTEAFYSVGKKKDGKSSSVFTTTVITKV